MIPCYDRERRTCIRVEQNDKHVKYIPLNVNEGLKVKSTALEIFNDRYQPILNYPIEKACELYIKFAKNIGSTKEALKYLSKVVFIDDQDIEILSKTKTVIQKNNPTADKKSSAAKMFRDLIIGGDLTDEQIFNQVQIQFKLNSNKRSYVQYYRKKLENLGINIPNAKL